MHFAHNLGVRQYRPLRRLRRDQIMKVVFAFVLLVGSATAALAQPHACAADAVAKADQLLRFHGEIPPDQPYAVDKEVKVLPSVKALKGNGRFDVLEIWGHIYKADYRMRLIYAQIKGACALMGQEILEASDPY
jgi:hypothetical protein